MNSKILIHYGHYKHVESSWSGVSYHGTNWRLIYVTSKGCRATTRHETVDLVPDHIYLLPPGLSFSTEQTNNPKQFYFHFDAADPYDKVQPNIYVLPINALLKELLELTFKEIRTGPFFLSARGTMYAIALTAACLAQIPEGNLEIKAFDTRIEEAIEYMESNLSETVCIESIAKQAGMSTGAFIRLFKSETYATPYAYLTELRIKWARELLTQGEVPIEQIADYTGFTDRFHFSRVFKKWIGVTPADYRHRGS